MVNTAEVDLMWKSLLFENIEIPDPRVLRRVPRSALRAFHGKNGYEIDIAFVRQERFNNLLPRECIVYAVHSIDIVE
jgi:hypothetical protein